MQPIRSIAAAVCFFLAAIPGLCAQQQNLPADELATNFKAPEQAADFDKRVVMIPMRDGVKLYTVIVIPKGAHDAPILLTRTCYNAAGRAAAPKVAAHDRGPASQRRSLRPGRLHPRLSGCSRQVRLRRPVPHDAAAGGPLNPTGADDTTDAYDTIDWLVKNVPESNGSVGMIGSRYEGFTVVMALLHPHPALKVAAPESPMVDGWMGDDWFHYGAFRQANLDYVLGQTAARGEGAQLPRSDDDYTNYLEAGSADAFARSEGSTSSPTGAVDDHPAYDGFWQSQALDHLIAKIPLTVPTLWEQGLWDQEDMWGAIHSLSRARGQGQRQRHELHRHGPVVPQPDQSRRPVLGPLSGRRHRARSGAATCCLPSSINI